MYFVDVLRSYFAWTRLRRVLATASSRNKNSSLHWQYRYRLGNWVMQRWAKCDDSISLTGRQHLCYSHRWFNTILLFVCHLCKLPIDPFSPVRCKTWTASLPHKINAGTKFASFKDILHGGRCVAYLLVAWFRGVHHQRILLAMSFSDGTLAC